SGPSAWRSPRAYSTSLGSDAPVGSAAATGSLPAWSISAETPPATAPVRAPHSVVRTSVSRLVTGSGDDAGSSSHPGRVGSNPGAYAASADERSVAPSPVGTTRSPTRGLAA